VQATQVQVTANRDAAASPPSAGIPIGARRTPSVPAPVVATSAPATRRATKRAPGNAEEAPAAAQAASILPVVPSAAGDELADAKKTARLASDEVAAALH
jgi:hypothetical protein